MTTIRGPRPPFVGAVYRATGGLSWEVAAAGDGDTWQLRRLGDGNTDQQLIKRTTEQLRGSRWRFQGVTAAAACSVPAQA